MPWDSLFLSACAVHLLGFPLVAECAPRQRGRERGRESGPGGLTREVERPLPSNSPHDHMILRVDWWAHTGGGNALAFKPTPECDQVVP